MGAYPQSVLEAVAKWWNAMELWLAQLWFPFQIALVMLVLLPVAWAVVALVDRGIDRIAAAVGRPRRTPDSSPGELSSADLDLDDATDIVRGDRAAKAGPS